MKFMFRKLFLSFVLCLFVIGFHPCLAYQPQRVAILPVSFRANASYDKTVETIITKALANQYHTFFSTIIPIYELIPETEMIRVLSDGTMTTWPSTLDSKLLIKVSDKLNADIVIAAEVLAFRGITMTNWQGDWIQDTDMAIRVIRYYRPSGTFVEQKDHQSYREKYTQWGRPDYMAQQMIADLLHKMPQISRIADQSPGTLER